MTIGSFRLMRHAAWSVVAVTLLGGAGQASAEMDHLTGYKVKESAPPLLSSHALQDALGSGNCMLKKAKFYLTGAEKDAGDDPRGGTTGDYICYTAKCDLPEPVLPLKDDQLATHALEAKKVKIVCLPAVNDGCGDNNLDGTEQCDGIDDLACPGFCQPDCTCVLPACGATTGGFCWFVGDPNESCNTVCANNGRVYDGATATYAGSGGSDANCQAVLSGLGVSAAFIPGAPCGSAGLGCAYNPDSNFSTRCAAPPTDATAAFDGRRACACQ